VFKLSKWHSLSLAQFEHYWAFCFLVDDSLRAISANKKYSPENK